MRHLTVVAVIAAAFVLSTARRPGAQDVTANPSARPVTFRGVVVDAANGAGLPRARLDVLVGGKRTAGTFTQDDGTFAVDITAPGRLSIASFAPLTVRTYKTGYATIAVTFTPDQVRAREGVRVAIPRAGVISGRLVSPSTVLPMVFARRGGSPLEGSAFTTPQNQIMVSALPDEDGNFRLGGLSPGRYIVEAPFVVTDVSGGVVSASSTSGPRMASVSVDVRAGVETSGVDLVYERTLNEPPATPAGPAGGSLIRGRVVALDGVPLGNATVSARAAGRSWNGATDASGQFTLSGLPPGSFAISAVRRGYIRAEHGQRGADLPGLPIVVEKGKNVDNVVITLSRGALVSGIVVDDHNEPLPDVAVQLSRVRQSTTGFTIVEGSAAGRPTDDRGMFALSDVRPGDYLLTATLPAEVTTEASATRTAFVPAFYPDTPDAGGAIPLRLQAGDVMSSVLLTLRRLPVVRVSGVAQTSQGTAFTGTLRLSHRHVAGFVLPPRVIQADTRGAFAFTEVPPGDYVLRAAVSSGPSGPEVAERGLTIVDSDPEPLSLRTMPTSSLSGHFVLDAPPGELLWGYSIRTLTAEAVTSGGGMTSLGSPTPNGESFRVTSLSGPTRIVVSTDDDGWYVRSIAIDGIDVTDVPFDFGFDGRQYTDAEVVFSQFGGSIDGRAIDDRASPVSDYAVYVFATDRDKWFSGSRWLKLVRSTGEGTFRVPSLPPGEYWLAAVDRVDTVADSRDWVDTSLLASLATRATRVAVGERQEQTFTLRVIRR
jgi:hypothetical protein